jgi:pilus assembly protein CpaE
MYPLNVVLAGQLESVLKPIRETLLSMPAVIDAEFPSLTMVQSGMQHQPRRPDRPWLFVVVLSSAEDYQHMRRIRETFVGHPILAVVDDAQDPVAVLAAMRSGAAQVVASPFDREDFLSAAECIALMFGFSGGGSKVIVVSGVTGGCGATTIATNLAYEIAQTRKQKTLLVELASQMGMVATYLDANPRCTTYDLFCNMDRVDVDHFRNTVTPVTDYLSILPGPQQLLAPREVHPRDVLQMIDFAKRLASVVVIDLPNTFNDLYFETLAAATNVILVAEQKLPSIRALKVVYDTLQRDVGLGVEASQRRLVLNRYTDRDREFSVAALEKTTGATGFSTIANDHQAVSGAIHAGKPLRLHAPRSKALTDLVTLTNSLFDAPPNGTTRKRPDSVLGMFKRAVGFGS